MGIAILFTERLDLIALSGSPFCPSISPRQSHSWCILAQICWREQNYAWFLVVGIAACFLVGCAVLGRLVGREVPGRAISRRTCRGGSGRCAQARRAVAWCRTSRCRMRHRGGTSDSGNDLIVAIYWFKKDIQLPHALWKINRIGRRRFRNGRALIPVWGIAWWQVPTWPDKDSLLPIVLQSHFCGGLIKKLALAETARITSIPGWTSA